MENTFRIRRMSRQEVADIAVAWAAKEGWNPGLHDAACFYAADPQGFFIGELGSQPVAVISAVAYDPQFAFMGFYIVHPEFRSKGYGMRIWKEALLYLGGRNIGGDGVMERIKDYETQGFKSYYKNRRYRGFGTGRKEAQNLAQVQQVDFESLAAYDDGIFPAPRHAFLKCWIEQPNTKGYVYAAKDKIAGYGVIRKCFKGYKIGPLFSDNSAAAEQIFNALIGSVEKDAEVFFDAPEANPQAIELAQRHKMQVVFETARIYSQKSPDVPLEKVFGVTSFELG